MSRSILGSVQVQAAPSSMYCSPDHPIQKPQHKHCSRHQCYGESVAKPSVPVPECTEKEVRGRKLTVKQRHKPSLKQHKHHGISSFQRTLTSGN